MRLVLDFLQFFLRDFLRWLGSSERAKSPHLGASSSLPTSLGPLSNVSRHQAEFFVYVAFLLPLSFFMAATFGKAVFSFWRNFYGP